MSILSSNPVSQALAGHNSFPHVQEAFTFFFLCAIVGEMAAKNRTLRGFWFYSAAATMRAWSSVGLVLPLVCGAMPSADWLLNYQHFCMLLGAIGWTMFVAPKVMASCKCAGRAFLPNDIGYSVVRANMCAAGVMAAKAAAPGNVFAPFIGGYVAVNGYRLAGFAFDGFMNAGHSYQASDDILGFLGPAVWHVVVELLHQDEVTGRVALVLFMMSTFWFDWAKVVDDLGKKVGF